MTVQPDEERSEKEAVAAPPSPPGEAAGSQVPEANGEEIDYRARAAELEAENEKLRQEVERLRGLAGEWQIKYRELESDFRRLRVRTQEEISSIRERAAEKLISRLLPVLDDLERASAAARGHDAMAARQALTEGVEMILANLRQVLEEEGLSPVAAEAGLFDPEIHEAVGYEITDEVPHGTVLRAIRRGYRLRDHLLRPASVIVARGQAPESEGHDSGAEGKQIPEPERHKAETVGQSPEEHNSETEGMSETDRPDPEAGR